MEAFFFQVLIYWQHPPDHWLGVSGVDRGCPTQAPNIYWRWTLKKKKKYWNTVMLASKSWSFARTPTKSRSMPLAPIHITEFAPSTHPCQDADPEKIRKSVERNMNSMCLMQQVCTSCAKPWSGSILMFLSADYKFRFGRKPLVYALGEGKESTAKQSPWEWYLGTRPKEMSPIDGSQ